MTFDPQAAGNKGIPAPRNGYEQRMVSYRNYNTAQIKGWLVRKEGGEVHKGGAVLCERFVGGVPDAIPESPAEEADRAPVLSPEFIKAFGEFLDVCSEPVGAPTEEKVVEYVESVLEQEVIETLGTLSTVSPVEAVIAAIGDAAKEVEDSLYGKSIIASDEFVKSQLERTAEIRNIVDELNAEKVIPVKTKKNKGKK